MIAGQTMVGSNGKQNTLFPLVKLALTQGENTGTHLGSLAMDFRGISPTTGGLMDRGPLYAPVDVKAVARWGSSSPQIVWESLDQVNFVDGTLDYLCIGINHDNDIPSIAIGTIKRQGELMNRTGTLGGVSDHSHIECAKGHYAGYFLNPQGVYMLRNQVHLYNVFGLNGTPISGTGGSYNWREFSDTPTPPEPTKTDLLKTNFPWVLYSSKIINHRQ